jgi:hypothetical protein
MGKLRHIAMWVPDPWKTANGVIFDISHNGWGGAQKNPGAAGNEIGPSRGLVPKFAERRAAAAAEMATRTRK